MPEAFENPEGLYSGNEEIFVKGLSRIIPLHTFDLTFEV